MSESLTKYENTITVVTSDVANSWYGGLYGSVDALGLDDDDPKVIGHIHDGQHLDGHAVKIDLVDHVSNQLINTNLADDAVNVRNIKSFEEQSSAIPEYEVVDGTTYYFLDLSTIRSEIGDTGVSVFEYDDSNNAILENTDFGPVFATTDFVFGSPTIAYSGNSDHAARMAFIKSRGAFRVGVDTSTNFEEANVGSGSFSAGSSLLASGLRSFAQGLGSEATTDYAVAFGEYAKASNYGEFAQASGRFATTGDAQFSRMILRGTYQADGVTVGQYSLDGSGTFPLLESGAVYFGNFRGLAVQPTTGQFFATSLNFVAKRGVSIPEFGTVQEEINTYTGSALSNSLLVNTTNHTLRPIITGGFAGSASSPGDSFYLVGVLELVKVKI